jgi:hypothetical protein
MGPEFHRRLKETYKDQSNESDVFGRRRPTAREIENAIGKRDGFVELEPDYQPTESDLEEKTDGT